MSGFADSLAAMGERKAIKAAIAQLDNMFDGAASRSFEAGVVHDWATEPYIHCGYSYPRVGGEGAFEELSKPLPNGRVSRWSGFERGAQRRRNAAGSISRITHRASNPPPPLTPPNPRPRPRPCPR